MPLWQLALYFILGGAVVASVTYFGSQGKGMVAAFLSMLPTISLITIISIYIQTGHEGSTAYLKGMLYVVPVWLLYIGLTIVLLPRLGLVPTLVITVGIYVGGTLLIMRLLERFTPQG